MCGVGRQVRIIVCFNFDHYAKQSCETIKIFQKNNTRKKFIFLSVQKCLKILKIFLKWSRGYEIEYSAALMISKYFFSHHFFNKTTHGFIFCSFKCTKKIEFFQSSTSKFSGIVRSHFKFDSMSRAVWSLFSCVEFLSSFKECRQIEFYLIGPGLFWIHSSFSTLIRTSKTSVSGIWNIGNIGNTSQR